VHPDTPRPSATAQPEQRRYAVVAVHDVSPATWRECAELFAMLDAAGVRRMSLLVIPNYHHRAPVAEDRAVLRALERRASDGCELVLHGMFHLDEEPAPRSIRDFVRRRMLTRSEGEFAALPRAEAARRIADGIALFAKVGWPLSGFVPPAWLMTRETRYAIEDAGHSFRYVSARGGLFRLPDWEYVPTANLCYSPTSAPRRAYSRIAIAHEVRRAHADASMLLRITLHPQDAREREVLSHWERLIGDMQTTYELTTKRDFIATTHVVN
jgi:predicted deacetylase